MLGQVRMISEQHYIMPYSGIDMHLVKDDSLFDALSSQGEIVFASEEVTLLEVFKQGMTESEWQGALQTIFDLKSVFSSARISKARGLIRHLCGTQYATAQNGALVNNSAPAWNNQIGMEFSLVSPGKFLMGNDADKYAAPKHHVTISNSFSLSRHLVTQRQFLQVVGYNPAAKNNPDAPVDCVSYHEALAFIGLLNKIEMTDYALPTEAQWEYAHQSSNGENAEDSLPISVGQDGIVEWVSDWWGAYPSDEATDPTGPQTGRFRVLRSGSSPAARRGAEPDAKIARVGFRVAHW